MVKRPAYYQSGLIDPILVFLAFLFIFWSGPAAQARPPIKAEFLDVYPNAVGSELDTVPSFPDHCGTCHYDFNGGGQKNPYGDLLAAELPNWKNNQKDRAIMAIEGQDIDGDGFSTLVEVTDTGNFVNTPTFPGLTAANLNLVTGGVDITEIQLHLKPSTGFDLTPPVVTVLDPNGGEILTGNAPYLVQWTAADDDEVSSIDLYLSLDNGATYKLVAKGLINDGSHTFYPANRPTGQALLRVVAKDNAFNEGQDESNALFSIVSPPGGIAPTTLRDFDLPGSQPFETGVLNPPEACAVCHGNYDSNVEPYFNWQGSMMAQASLDPLFLANMAIANQDAPDSGDLCLRCHFPRGWLQGRSVPTDGSQMLPEDNSGVACDLCHRLVDPIFDAENPAVDLDIINSASNPPTDFGNGMYLIDPDGLRRGPFTNADSGHPVAVSPFHREAALCGTCHDVSNPAFEKDGNGNYLPNAFDAPPTSTSAHTMMPVERTYSEWFYSDYNTPAGVYAPEFAGNKADGMVATCQDCHMRDVNGQGCNLGNPPVRPDLPLHDLTGGSTWLMGLMASLYPGEVNAAAMQAAEERGRYLLQNAADMTLEQEGDQLEVTVTNNSGHKLPTGYPEGRRVWLNIKFYDANTNLIGESGAYDPNTGVLTKEGAKVYEVKPGLDGITAQLTGDPNGPSFHFVLNNKVYKDNRIPPRGFTNANFESFGDPPVAYSYADGQYWDETYYALPATAATAEVTLYYQSTSKEFVEFLRDENETNTLGQEVYDIWNNNGKCPPEVMAQAQLSLIHPEGDVDQNFVVDANDLFFWINISWLETDCALANDWCSGADFDHSGKADLADFVILSGLAGY